MKKISIYGIISIIASILIATSLLWVGTSCDLIRPTSYCLNLFYMIAGLFILGIVLLIISLALFIKDKQLAKRKA
jgi:hypothetical protein